MNNVEKIRKILITLGVPEKQQNDLCCYVLLVMGKIYPDSKWKDAKNEWIRIHDMMSFINMFYRETPYAENTRETVRKNALHHFRTAAFVEDNGLATNSPNYRYQLTEEFLNVLKNKGSEESVRAFLKRHESLKSIYASKKDKQKQALSVNGLQLTLSPGKHNKLQKAIIEDFAPRFAPNAKCLYVGDTTEKDLVKDVETLKKIGDQTKKVKAGKIFVTAFLDFATYKKFAADLAWDTEVWIAEMLENMIHLNGDRFLGPRG